MPSNATAYRRGRMETHLGLPARPKRVHVDGDTAWMAQAACGQPEVPEADRDAFLTVDRQADAWPLVGRYCATCPVREMCLADGRNVHGWGLYGGIVLAGGRLAADGYGDASYRDPQAWVPPWERVDLVELARNVGGITAREAAVAVFGPDPTTAQIEEARRQLKAATDLASTQGGRLYHVKETAA